MSVYKPFGYELKHVLFGGVLARCEYASAKLDSYVKGEIGCIEELDEQPLLVAPTVDILGCMTV